METVLGEGVSFCFLADAVGPSGGCTVSSSAVGLLSPEWPWQDKDQEALSRNLRIADGAGKRLRWRL